VEGSGSGDVFSKELVRKALVPMGIGVLAYGALLFYADAEAITGHVSQITAAPLLASTVLALASYVVRFLRWQYYLRCLDLDVPVSESALVFTSGFAMSITPGKMGEVLKSLLLKDSRSIPVARSAPIVLTERVSDLAALLALGAAGLFAMPNGRLPAFAAIAMLLGLYFVCTFRSLGHQLIDLASRFPRIARVRPKLEAAYSCVLELTRPLPFAIGLLLSVLAWGIASLSLNVIAWGFSGVTLSVLHGFVAFCAPLLAGALALIPGGLGVTEASMTAMLQHLGGEGMTMSVAALVTLLSRLTSFWLAIGLGFLALLAWRSRHATR
jgi:uncharacterized protein (TIRG00374 family)